MSSTTSTGGLTLSSSRKATSCSMRLPSGTVSPARQFATTALNEGDSAGSPAEVSRSPGWVPYPRSPKRLAVCGRMELGATSLPKGARSFAAAGTGHAPGSTTQPAFWALLSPGDINAAGSRAEQWGDSLRSLGSLALIAS
jgi:hypothetical protein